MTITTDYSPVQYNGNGVTTSFAFPYAFYDDTDLIVTTTVVLTGVDTVRVLNTDYTVTGGDGANGTVIFGTAPANGVRVTIEVSIPYRQENDYVENQAFPADTLEQSLDRSVIRDQQLKSAVDRSVKFPATLAGSLVGLLPQPIDGKLLVWDGVSGQIGNADIADVSSTLNTIITSPVSGQVLTWNGTNWVNDSADFTSATANINMNFVYKLENMANPFNPQDAATKAYVDAIPIRKIVQVQETLSSAFASGTTTIPLDDTIPQITEGTEFLTQSITPQFADSILEVEVVAFHARTTTDVYLIGALFRDSTANAVAADGFYSNVTAATGQVIIRYSVVAGSTSATTFRYRAGLNSAGTVGLNGSTSARLFGNIPKSYIKVTERRP